MRSNPYIVHALKYATLTLLGAIAIIAAAFLMKQSGTGSLTGRLVSQQVSGVTPTMKFDEARALDGFSAPADTNVIFTVPRGTRIPRITFFGGSDYNEKRYWGYCFSGNEVENKAKGYLGKKMYDGQFFYSLAERKAQTERPVHADNDLVGILDSTNQTDERKAMPAIEILSGGQTCYVMSEVALPVGTDRDGDELNSEREREMNTDPNYPDTDNDGIADGSEVFVTKTNPRLRDTDLDGLPDRCEDKNANGPEEGETSATVVDTDRDGLCDGSGYASACPEPKQHTCYQDKNNERICDLRPSTPVFGEDMNQNCSVDTGETDPRNPETFGRPDWDYKWSKLQSQTGNRQMDTTYGTKAPEFPIPSLPVDTQ